YGGFQVAAGLMLGTGGKRLSCRVVLVGALAPLQAQAQLFAGASLLGKLGLDNIEQSPRFLQDAVPDGIVASCNERLQLTDASRRQLRLARPLCLGVAFEQQEVDVRVLLEERGRTLLPGSGKLCERLEHALGVCGEWLGS